MKIAVCNDDFPPEGGSSVASVVRLLADEWRQLGHDVLIITRHSRLANPNISRREGVISLPIETRPLLRHYQVLYRPSVSSNIRSILQEFRPDVVSAHNIHGYLTYHALTIASSMARVTTLTCHDVMAFAFGRLNTQRFLDSGGQDAHLTIADHWQAAGISYNPLRNWFIRRTLRQAGTRLVAVSRSLQDAMRNNGLPGAQVIHHGLPTRTPPPIAAITEFRRRFTLGDRPVLLFGGRISQDKGTDCIIDALPAVLAAVPDALLLVVGDENRWRSVVSRRQSDIAPLSQHIRLTGWLNTEEMCTAYAAATAVTTPSLCLDTFNLMNLEGMAAGKPVVGTIFGGTPEVVQHEVTGYVCDPRQTSTYAAYLSAVLSDSSLAERLGQAGQKRAEQTFSSLEKAQQYLALFQDDPSRPPR